MPDKDRRPRPGNVAFPSLLQVLLLTRGGHLLIGMLVERCGQVLGAMAATIDLNPVRIRIVVDPKDYRLSGYGSAMAGRRVAKEGLRKVVSGLQRGVESLSGALEVYRMFLYLEGSEERGGEGDCKTGGCALPPHPPSGHPLPRGEGRRALRRKSGARRMRGLAGEESFTVRDLRVDVFG